ncbi:hypothetical protein [uncultured Rothia sp.]|uniref:hypothetical protein n=1 Tax=uncultured Rothia sp. TaxID=316088 RepID=UPI0025FAF39B|nr:hypothetical protein [uncultured Rothia sp.]
MSERTPKQPLNDPEYTVPEYSVLLPSDEAENSTAESNAASNSTALSSGAVGNNAAEDNTPGGSASGHASTEHTTTGYREATVGYTAPTASEHAGRVRPKALRSAKRCMTVIIILLLFRNIQTFILLKNLTSSLGALSLLFTLGFPLIFILIQIFLFWKTWEGHRWAHILILVCSAYEVLSRMYWFAQDFFMDSRYLTWLMEYLQSYDSMDLAISLLLSTAVGVVLTILYIRIIVLLTRPPVWAYTTAGSTSHSQVVGQNPPAPDLNSNEGGNRLN